MFLYVPTAVNIFYGFPTLKEDRSLIFIFLSSCSTICSINVLNNIKLRTMKKTYDTNTSRIVTCILSYRSPTSNHSYTYLDFAIYVMCCEYFFRILLGTAAEVYY